MKNRYRLLNLIWFLPLVLAGLTIHQIWTYYNITYTYTEGESYTAEVVEFDIKQIAAQTNGYVILRFETRDGKNVQRKLSLPVQMAAQIMESKIIPVRYHPDSSTPIVMIKTYDTHKRLSLINAAISFVSVLATVLIAIFTSKYARSKRNISEPVKIIRTDD